MATKKQAFDWALAPAPESKDHFTLKSEYDLFIGGKWQKPKSGKYFDTINPANEQKIVGELLAVQGKPVDVGGYYQPDDRKAAAALRPSATFNAILGAL